MTDVCLVIPCFNEQNRLPQQQILESVQRCAGLSICFVDDGSTDGTLAILSALKAKAPANIDVISLEQSVDFKPRFDYERQFKGHRHRFTGLYDFRYDRFNDESPLPGAKVSGLHTRRTNAVFFQDEISLLGERLLFNPSVRYEHANDFGGDVALRGLQIDLAGADEIWQQIFELVLHFRVPCPIAVALGPEIARIIGASFRDRRTASAPRGRPRACAGAPP